jgi:putative transposase
MTQRNGYRDRVVTTAAGDVELRIPKLCAGSFFPSLLEGRRRIDQALFAVVMEAYVHGVSRKVDDLVAAMGTDSGISKSEVSRICAGLDVEVAAFRDRSLSEQGFPTCLWMPLTARLASAAIAPAEATESPPRPLSWPPG